ncbi:MAG: hypothetical protein ACLTAX_03185 [Waltera sp.]
MADRRFLTLRKTIMLYICIWNIFLLTGCAKTEMVSEDNTVTNENIASTTGNIEIETEAIETETETQDAIQTIYRPTTGRRAGVQDYHGRGYTSSHPGGGKLFAAGWKLRL